MSYRLATAPFPAIVGGKIIDCIVLPAIGAGAWIADTSADYHAAGLLLLAAVALACGGAAVLTRPAWLFRFALSLSVSTRAFRWQLLGFALIAFAFLIRPASEKLIALPLTVGFVCYIWSNYTLLRETPPETAEEADF